MILNSYDLEHHTALWLFKIAMARGPYIYIDDKHDDVHIEYDIYEIQYVDVPVRKLTSNRRVSYSIAMIGKIS